MANDLLGRWGESLAAAYLQKRRYRIVAANYRCRFGEIDLIAADTIEERIVLLQQEKKALSDGVLLGEDSLFTVDAAALREILKG